MTYRAGIDVGSTTVKLVIFAENQKCVFAEYERHFSDVLQATKKILQKAQKILGEDCLISLTITGSGGMGLAKKLEIPFVQEVIACTKAVEELIPQTDVVIELGGEDAKIIFFKENLEQRMNGSCAGGTGAFIDQMATLLKTDAEGLNELAKDYQTIYPIASRCGVFAKTDVQPLINEGAAKEDIAASIFQAVVHQTIAGLASGRKIEGKVAFLGGPLFFLSELKQRFVETLDLSLDEIVSSENPQLFVALGAALFAHPEETKSLQEILRCLENEDKLETQIKSLPCLFSSAEELALFRERHKKARPVYRLLENYQGAAFLGIDAGSTTSKVILLSKDMEILFSYYGKNEGQPLENIKEVLFSLYQKLPVDVYLANTCVTGYGEELIKKALKVDLGIVETMAHYKAANYFYPGVDFILDIGGQDMKAITIREGALANIQLNEACSSGCGSFIEGFAKSLNYSIEDFAKKALYAKHPADLGSRCTVFMNSKVKQAQKDGISIGDLSAGLSYSVIKNALYKVIKVRRASMLGEKIVVQGGTFCNDAILRTLEMILNQEVIRPEIAGLMGAYGAALIAKENAKEGLGSSLLSSSELEYFKSKKDFLACKLCENKCKLTKHVFSDGRNFITGNRCERGTARMIKQQNSQKKKKINLVSEKYRHLFAYKRLTTEKAIHGTIGLPRVLNIYENYPLWVTFFTKLGFKFKLSPRSDKALYEKGIDTIPSDTVCYPAKLAHGHIKALIDAGVLRIFYPSVIFEQIENEHADNHFNCPIVQSYPEVIRNNVDEISMGKVNYHYPFLNLANEASVAKQLWREFRTLGFSLKQIKQALHEGYLELEAFKKAIRQKGEDTLAFLTKTNQRGIVLAGRPYHLDSEINHGIAEAIVKEGFHVLTEDSIAHLANVTNLRVVDQWVYHSRLYQAARVVAKTKNLELVQLNSFGCGIDAVTTDQVEEILAQTGKIYTVLKIDEGENLGAIRIRLRSLKATVDERARNNFTPTLNIGSLTTSAFTKDMKNKHTLLMPMLSPIHQESLLDEAFKACGYEVISLFDQNSQAIDVGLKYVNNDACYPAIISIGQLIEALQSGKYDLNNVSVMMTQTGGGCRATNYIPLLRKALIDANLSQVPIISLSFGNKGVEQTAGFKMTFALLKRMAIACFYGDLFERVVYRTRPYEKQVGLVDQMHQFWLEYVRKNVRNGSLKQFNQNVKAIVKDFDQLDLSDLTKQRVGVVGEILVKYSPMANNDIVRLLEAEGAQVVVPDLFGFMNYSLYNQIWKYKNLGTSRKSRNIAKFFIKLIELLEKPMNKALQNSQYFSGISSIKKQAKEAEKILSLGNHTGEGWFLTGEMLELLQAGVNNIVCMQPFGCLPNHVVGKGTMKKIRRHYPQANIIAIDYDPGASLVNQLNRIYLMMETAKKEPTNVK
ncbi:MAG: 2-hydroxyacyl-CoA dehydratase [Lactobacillales bacterium]|nr:2-hydroxyacyl-CoA dehydratase [Lactobacillales bacterium]